MKTEIDVLTDIIVHTSEVKENLAKIRADLEYRSLSHDRSKYRSEEFDAFVKTRPKFKKVNYDSKEYQKCINKIKPAVDHHHLNNRHHTAFHKKGFEDMNLIDILEMLADWKAASKRSPDLTFEKSLPKAFSRYDIPKNMQEHIKNTLLYLGWL